MTSLYLKHLLLRTPLEAPAHRLRDMSRIFRRIKHPELRELYLEDKRAEHLMRQVIKLNSNCIDIGSHIGSFLSQLMRLAPQGKHVAFEPVPQKALWLKKKFPEVDVRSLALGDKQEKRTFYQNASQPGFSGFGGDFADVDKVVELTVECEILDNIIRADRKYDYVKIDVEGAELMVLKGARKMIARDTPFIFFESSHDGAAKLGLKREDLFALFVDELAYDVFLIKDFLDERPPLTLTDFQRAALYPFQAFNFLAVPRRDSGGM
jgi:FkbM family methyltransferase